MLYIKHDSPGGIQDMNTFKRLNDTNRVRICWHFPDKFLIIKIKLQKEFFELNKFKYKCNMNNLKNFILANLTKNAKKNLRKHYNTTNLETILHFKLCNLRQFWMDVCTPVGSYIYLRGKKNKLPEGYLLKVITNEIEYDNCLESNKNTNLKMFDNNWITMKRRYEIIKKVSDETYNLIKGCPKSIWLSKKYDIINII